MAQLVYSLPHSGGGAGGGVLKNVAREYVHSITLRWSAVPNGDVEIGGNCNCSDFFLLVINGLRVESLGVYERASTSQVRLLEVQYT